jgi:hypothetical protein
MVCLNTSTTTTQKRSKADSFFASTDRPIFIKVAGGGVLHPNPVLSQYSELASAGEPKNQ